MAGEEAVEGNNKRKFSSSTSLLPWTSTPLCPRQASLCPGQAQFCCTGRTSRDATAVQESQFGLKLKRWTKMMRPLSDVLVTSSLPATQPIVPQHQLDKCHGNNALSHSRTLTQTFSGEETLTFLVISYFGRRHSSNFFNALQIYFPFHDTPLSAGLFPCVKHKRLFSYSFIF